LLNLRKARRCDKIRRRVNIAILGPSADKITGSLLRPLNIWYSLRDLRSINLTYVPISNASKLAPLVSLVSNLSVIMYFDVVIVSGVGPLTATIASLLRALIRKVIIVDFHGSAWYESSIMGTGTLYKIASLVAERLICIFSTYVIVASPTLAMILRKYYRRRIVYIIPNVVTSLFMHIVDKLAKFNGEKLMHVLEERTKKFIAGKRILLAPLPKVFLANILAIQQLMCYSSRIAGDYVTVITGSEDLNTRNVISIGYIPFVKYVALLLISDAVLLPFPSRAICGGARNKILEAAYCRKPIITTKTGVMHIPAKPWVHYIPLEEADRCNHKTIFILEDKLKEAGLKFYELVSSQYSFVKFKASLLRFLKNTFYQRFQKRSTI